MKKYLICISLLLCSFFAYVQVEKDNSLFKAIMTQDSLLFNVGFNTCAIRQFEVLLTDNFEFFHDKSGMSDKKKFLVDLKKGLCANPGSYQARRELIPGTTLVYALFNNGKLYGAIQEGIHQFFEKQTGKPEKFGSSARFTHVWLLKDGVWKLARSLSFEHEEKQIPTTSGN
jgi:hypothetical protein